MNPAQKKSFLKPWNERKNAHIKTTTGFEEYVPNQYDIALSKKFSSAIIELESEIAVDFKIELPDYLAWLKKYEKLYSNAPKNSTGVAILRNFYLIYNALNATAACLSMEEKAYEATQEFKNLDGSNHDSIKHWIDTYMPLYNQLSNLRISQFYNQLQFESPEDFYVNFSPVTSVKIPWYDYTNSLTFITSLRLAFDVIGHSILFYKEA